MIKKKPYDGMVVAARFTHKGEIDWVRAFIRHGFVFSDRLSMDRETLLTHRRDGKRFRNHTRSGLKGSLVTQAGSRSLLDNRTARLMMNLTAGNVVSLPVLQYFSAADFTFRSWCPRGGRCNGRNYPGRPEGP